VTERAGLVTMDDLLRYLDMLHEEYRLFVPDAEKPTTDDVDKWLARQGIEPNALGQLSKSAGEAMGRSRPGTAFAYGFALGVVVGRERVAK
jgi:hypothetical protein